MAKKCGQSGKEVRANSVKVRAIAKKLRANGQKVRANVNNNLYINQLKIQYIIKYARTFIGKIIR